MASNRLKRTMRGALAATAVVAVIGVTPSLASADPSTTPSTPNAPTMPTGTPLQQYEALAQQASDVNNQLEDAQTTQAADNAKLAAANADLAKAQQAEQTAEQAQSGLQGSVDQLTEAQYEGARFGQLSALLTGDSAKDYLDKASLLQDMAETSDTTLNSMQSVTDAAASAQQRARNDQQTAQNATNAANALVAQIQQEEKALQPLEQQAEKALQSVNPEALKGSIDPSQFILPPGEAGEAIQAAEAEIGKPYQWGGAGPSNFDCSGLMMWAWGKVGVSLPHSSLSQSQMGTLVPSEADLQPGDLVFFGHPVHHVGMYVGGGDMVDAPETGQDVQIQAIFSGFVFGRRL